ncbi:uncharacterized protein [Ptychodera flava]|uniref:uncharacterized protein n=1 Tax=Ptychodera flava TaxID=63121 RepID=UPI00396A64E6
MISLKQQVYTTVSLVLVLFIRNTTATPVKRDACRHPGEDDLRAMLGQYVPNALSFATSPGAYSAPASTDCPVSYGSSAPLSMRSNCPYYNVENTDGSRYPPTLVEAECYKCQKCITDLRDDSEFHPLWSCEKLTTRVWVLRNSNVCIGGVYQYNAVQVDVALACTCVRERL